MYFIETDDRLVSKILTGNHVRRENFDPKNKEHIESFKKYMSTGNWGKVQFYVESNYVTVPETVLSKYCKHHLNML